jgi:hypothetical protein
VPPQDYNTYTAQQESSGNPNMGYHYPDGRSTAYGMYGITAPAYRDIQAANPAFANRPITSLSPEEQGQANQTLRGVYGQQLKAQGVEPTEGNIRLSHLLGARGAQRYLESGYLSPEAIAANGGEQKLRAIAESRMGSVAPQAQAAGQPQMRPAVAQGTQIAQPPAAVTYDDRFAAAQTDPNAMYLLSKDKSAPDYIRKAAADQHYAQLTRQRMEEKTEKDVAKMFESGNTTDFARMIKSSSQEGSYVKAYLFQRFGLNDLAKQEQQKLGADNKWQTVIGPNAERSIIQYDGNGLPISGYDQKGRQLTGDQLVAVAASGTSTAKSQTGGEIYYDPMQPSGPRFAMVKTPEGAYFRELSTQRAATPEEQSKLVKMGVSGPLEQQAASAYASRGAGQQGTQAAQTGTQQGALPPRAGAVAPAQQAQPQAQPAAGPVPPTAMPPAAPAAAPAAPQAAPAAAPAAQAQPAPTGRQPTQTATQLPVQEPGEPFAVYQARLKSAQAAQEKEAEIAAEDIATVRKSQGTNESTVDTNIDRVSALLDPQREGRAFESSVGATLLPGARFVPGSPQSSWFKLFDEVKGGQFLSAIKQMKGFGALSDMEGKAATQAISRLSASQNEQDFRRAANDYMDIVTRGVDRDRAKLGQPPKYGTPESTERARMDREAMEWLKANPKDPAAKDVRQRLKDRGLL